MTWLWRSERYGMDDIRHAFERVSESRERIIHNLKGYSVTSSQTRNEALCALIFMLG